jgi:hypothetical protein
MCVVSTKNNKHNNEWRRKGKKIAKYLCLDQDLVSFFTAKRVYTVITVDGPLDRLDGRHRQF